MKPSRLLLLLALLGSSLPAQARVEKVDSVASSKATQGTFPTAILRFDGGPENPWDGALRLGQLLYRVEGGEVKTRLRVIRLSKPRAQVEILSGALREGDSVGLTMALSWQNLFTDWDASRLAAMAQAGYEVGRGREFERLAQSYAGRFGLSLKENLATTAGTRAFLGRLFEAIGRRNAAERKDWEKFAQLAWRHYGGRQNVDALLDLWLARGVDRAVLPDALELRARCALESGNAAEAERAVKWLGRIVEEKMPTPRLARVVLLLAEAHRLAGRPAVAEKYLAGLSKESEREEDWEEAVLERHRLLVSMRKFPEALAALEDVKRNSRSLDHLLQAFHLEIETRLTGLGDREGAERVRAQVERDFPADASRAEFDWLDLEAARVDKALPYLSLARKRLGSPVGLRALRKGLSLQIKEGSLGDVFSALAEFRTVWPTGSARFGVLASILPSLLERCDRFSADDAPLPIPEVSDARFYALLDDCRRSYRFDAKGGGQGRFLQSLALLRWLAEDVVERAGAHDPDVVEAAQDVLVEAAKRWAKESVREVNRLRVASRRDGYPPSAALRLEWRNLQDWKDVDAAYADKSALEILRLGSDTRGGDGALIDDAFAWIASRIRALPGPHEKILLFEQARDLWGRVDLRLDDLARSLRDLPPARAVESRLRAADDPRLPSWALVFDAANRLDHFDLARDLKAVEWKKDRLVLRVSGKEARLESRLLALPARDFRVLRITVVLDRLDLLDRGELWWQNWDEQDWNPKKRVAFHFLGDGEVTAEVPLDHEDWKNTIRRLRINFYADRVPSLQSRIEIKKVALF